MVYYKVIALILVNIISRWDIKRRVSERSLISQKGDVGWGGVGWGWGGGNNCVITLLYSYEYIASFLFACSRETKATPYLKYLSDICMLTSNFIADFKHSMFIAM